MRPGCAPSGRTLASVSLVFAIAAVLRANEFDIVLTEVHYHPVSGDDRDEFVELLNRGPTAVDLSGFSFSEGISLVIPPGFSLNPGEYLVVSADAAYTKSRYGITNVVGNYSGRLDNGGEVLVLSDAHGAEVARVHYLDEDPWPSTPDGLGPSLELVSLAAQPDLVQSWAPSLFLHGTPGHPNSRFDGAPGPDIP